MQWYRTSVAIPKGGGSTVRKFAKPEASGTNPKSYSDRTSVWDLYFKDFWCLCPSSFAICYIHLSFGLYAALLARNPIALASSTSWVLHCIPGFTLTDFCNGILGSAVFSRPSFRDYPATHCLISSAHWKHRTTIYDPFTLGSFMPLKTAPSGTHCQHDMDCYRQLLFRHRELLRPISFTS